jgi:hypothetical protein
VEGITSSGSGKRSQQQTTTETSSGQVLAAAPPGSTFFHFERRHPELRPVFQAQRKPALIEAERISRCRYDAQTQSAQHPLAATDYYNSHPVPQINQIFMVCPSFCNIAALP